MRPRTKTSINVALSCVVTAGSCTLSQAQFFRIDPLAPRTRAPATAVSADGRVVVGYSEVGGTTTAYSWTLENGRTDWLRPGGFGGYSYWVSEDGRFDVGRAFTSTSFAFRREVATGLFLELSNLVGYTLASGLGVSRDGSVTVGRVWRGTGVGGGTANASMAVRWDASGTLMPIGYLHAGDTFSDATAVTPDGNTIVGSSRHNYDVTYAYRWTAATGMVQLQLPPASFQSALAFGVSADGRYVIGAANGAIPGPDYTAAVRWDEHGSYEGIPFIPDYDSGKAYGITPDGRTIVGEMGDSEGGLNAVTAFIWREGAGTMFLADYLRDRSSV